MAESADSDFMVSENNKKNHFLQGTLKGLPSHISYSQLCKVHIFWESQKILRNLHHPIIGSTLHR